jgi:hypothetical protein
MNERSIARDMQHLALWLPAIEWYGGVRPERLDEHSDALWRAVLVQRRLTALALRDMRSAILAVDLYVRNNGYGTRVEEHVAVRWLPRTKVREWLLNWDQNRVARERAASKATTAAADAWDAITKSEMDGAAKHTATVTLLLNTMEQHRGRTREEIRRDAPRPAPAADVAA